MRPHISSDETHRIGLADQSHFADDAVCISLLANVSIRFTFGVSAGEVEFADPEITLATIRR
jgi:hypothetical protein